MRAAPLPPNATASSHPADTSSTEGLAHQYDFIIIGGGTAGLAVASRLSEDPSVQVLVLEAGANRSQDPMIMTPGFGFAMYDNPAYDYAFQTVPQKSLNGRIVPHQRGKVLGGSSAIYQMQMVYSSKGSFDAWEKLGNHGWDWNTMLPYLRKFHTHHPPGPADLINSFIDIAIKEEAVESTEGPVQTSYSVTGEIEKAWYESWKKIISELKYEGDVVGALAIPAAIDPKSNTRSYAVTAYYSADVSSRANLRVVTEALVSKIVFSNESDITASAVQFVSKTGETHIIKTAKEIILSAGVFASPQLLEVSGIGDAKHLQSHDIEVVLDNPNVGENLQDHAIVGVGFEVVDGVQTAEIIMRNPEIMRSLAQMYQKDRFGPLGQHFIPFAQFRLPEICGDDGSIFVQSLFDKVAIKDDIVKERDEVTVELNFQATVQQLLFKGQFNVKGNNRISDIAKPVSEGNYATVMTALNHPFSRGHVHIRSSNPADAPAIDPNYMSHPMDLELMARHIQGLSTLITTPPFSTFLKPEGRRVPTYAFPASTASAKGVEEMDLDQAKYLVKEGCMTNYHPAGSCSMLPKEKGGVVDEKLKVWGVKRLRVVDASIFPVMPRGNIITSVYAVAERAADLLKEEWGLKSL